MSRFISVHICVTSFVRMKSFKRPWHPTSPCCLQRFRHWARPREFDGPRVRHQGGFRWILKGDRSDMWQAILLAEVWQKKRTSDLVLFEKSTLFECTFCYRGSFQHCWLDFSPVLQANLPVQFQSFAQKPLEVRRNFVEEHASKSDKASGFVWNWVPLHPWVCHYSTT